MLSKEARNALTAWGSHGCRITKSSLETKKEGIPVNCYAPTIDNNVDDKDQFYERLQSVIATCDEKVPDHADGRSKRQCQNEENWV
ncbi:unnamed protein product [Schistosoma mattheei]|uniref:Uncharacterized protein n=1 Tax=Schistosoma mattheei TaxID=31246 RepID=A0A183Q7E5_9TREM|nr:unnamed protein product [Schistosoma mattheei]